MSCKLPIRRPTKPRKDEQEIIEKALKKEMPCRKKLKVKKMREGNYYVMRRISKSLLAWLTYF